MKDKRKLEILKAFMKGVLRKKEKVCLNGIITVQEVQAEVHSFNVQSKLNPPLTVAEFYELYAIMMEELMAEYVESLKKKVAEVCKK